MTFPRERHPLHGAIDARLADILKSSPTPLPWHEAWLSLECQSTDEEHLAVYQAVSKAGSIPADAGFFLVAWQLDIITGHYAEEELREQDGRLEAIRVKHNLQDDVSTHDEGVPEEYLQAMQEYHSAWDDLYVATLEKFGEHAMARLFRQDREKFDQRYEAGRQFFHVAEDEEEASEDDWLGRLLGAVAACVETDSPMGPLGMRCQEDEDFCEIWIYPTPVELVGGPHDGEVVVPGFSLNLEQFRAIFDTAADFGWNSLGLSNPEGPYIYIEGTYQGREVFLQVQAQAPEDEEPGLKFDATRRPQLPGLEEAE